MKYHLTSVRMAIQLPGRVRLFTTPWTAAHQVSLSLTIIYFFKKWNKIKRYPPQKNSDLEVTFGDALSSSAHFQEGKLRSEKVIHQCSEQDSGPLIPTSEPVSERATPGLWGVWWWRWWAWDRHLQRLSARPLGSAGTLGKAQGGSLAAQASLPGQELTRWDGAVFKAALGHSYVFKAFPGPA